MFTWQSRPRWALDISSQSAAYDSERLRRQYRWLYSPRLRKVAICLLLIDVTVIGLLVWSIEPLITLLSRNEELFGPRFTPSHNDTGVLKAPVGPHRDEAKIPRILHQTCATATIPDTWVYPQRTCKEAYSDFEYKLWTDELARAFIATEYPWFLETWDSYPFPIQRADSIRYFVLHSFGGIYLDMDTICKDPFPVDRIEPQRGSYALFKSTTPTGITNDFMISTAMHPVFTQTISKLPVFYGTTKLWAHLEPYTAIMLSAGPLFLTLAVKDYLLEQPSLPSPTVWVAAQAQLKAYITDLESASWHRWDTMMMMWIGERPWTWISLGVLGLVIGIYLFNSTLLLLWKAPRKVGSLVHALKWRK